ncbi:MAG: hypothetical protein P8Y52_14700, partial [Xanthomonadales bacterium]
MADIFPQSGSASPPPGGCDGIGTRIVDSTMDAPDVFQHSGCLALGRAKTRILYRLNSRRRVLQTPASVAGF